MRISVGLLLFATFIAHSATCYAGERSSFENEVYKVSELSKSGISSDRFANLTAAEKERIKAGVALVRKLLRAINNGNEEAYRLLGKSMQGRYASWRAFADEVADSEAIIKAYFIDDFDLAKSGPVNFFAILIVSSEGVYTLHPRKIQIVQEGGAPKIFAFEAIAGNPAR